MNREQIASAFTLCATLTLMGTLPAWAAGPSPQELQRQLDRQSQRIDRLEQAVEDLDYQLRGQQLDQANSDSRLGHDDPMVGTWQCTDQVFTYDISFFADGRLLQEVPTFGKYREGSWRRSGDDEITLKGGTKLYTDFRSEDRMIVEKVPNQGQSSWDCEKTGR